MPSQILGRVAPAAMDEPRGPDVLHRICVNRRWFRDGAAIQFELPRNLSCAACDGGGCDLCERSGAITMRAREAPPELVTVTLPQRKQEDSASQRGVMLRIPEQGGMADPASSLPRGALLLRVMLGDTSDPGVRRVRRSEYPGGTVDFGTAKVRRRSTAVTVLMVAVVLWILLLILLRLSGVA
jgi:hypothetical protein